MRAGSATDATGRCIGQTDLPLSAAGMRECRALSRQIHLPTPTVISSDLLRARATAAMLSHAYVIEESRLREMHFGEWEGLSWSELERQVGSAPLDRPDTWTTIRPPGGECFADVVERVASWLDALPADGGDYLVVAHAGTIRAAAVVLLKIQPDRASALSVDHARVSSFEILQRGASLIRWNSTGF